MDWLRVQRLYRRAFPPTERKPFSIIRRMARQGRTDVWLCEADGRFAGLAATINSPSLILLDYFAVSDTLRGQGGGTAFLQDILQKYAGKGLFVEIERPDGSAEKQARRRFYEHCGLTDLHTSANVFGVPMMLLGRGCTLNFDAYHAFYASSYNPWAADHITPL